MLLHQKNTYIALKHCKKEQTYKNCGFFFMLPYLVKLLYVKYNKVYIYS